MRDNSRVKHLVQKLNANINYDGKPRIEYDSGNVKAKCAPVKRLQTATVENQAEKRINESPVSQTSENESQTAFFNSKPVEYEKQMIESHSLMYTKEVNNTIMDGKPLQKDGLDNVDDASATEEEITRLRETENRLVNEIQELREQNELLEFRLLELEYYNSNSANRQDPTETADRDDVSDSGVTSLSPCDDFYLDYDGVLDSKSDEDDQRLICSDIQHKLSKLGEYVENKADKVIVQRAIDLIKHYQMKATGMETALTNMCQERINQQCENEFLSCLKTNEERLQTGTNRVIASIPPFSSQTNESSSDGSSFFETDRLQESGIFDEFADLEAIECKSCETQTDTDESTDSFQSGDGSSRGLAIELKKLEKIKRRIEERHSLFHTIELTMDDDNSGEDDKRGNAKIKEQRWHSPTTNITILAKELSYYKKHYRQLEEKLSAYEANGDSKTRRLSDALTKENVLKHRVDYLTNKMVKMQKEMKRLEEEKCEFEEAENDTRLRCQKLEVKLYALAEKKNDIQFQLQQQTRMISNLHNTLTELEKKKDEAFRKLHDMETLANEYEQRNFELEEREMEVKYRLQMLESATPALILWNMLVLLKHLQHTMKNHNAFIPLRALIAPNVSMPDHSDETNQKLLIYYNNFAQNNGALTFLNDNCRIQHASDLQHAVRASTRRRWYLRTNGNGTELKLPSQHQQSTKERVYAQTLQQADELIASIESEFEKKLRNIENTLTDKRWKLEECERKLAIVSSAREIENHLTEKTINLESEIVALKRKLKLNEEEKLLWQRKERDLMDEIERLHTAIGRIEDGKREIREQFERERTVNKEYEDELQFKAREMQDLEVLHANQVKQLENRLLRAKREVENHEVTNSELKEEVDTLESTICELNATLEREKDEKEKLMIQFRKELTQKQQEVDSLKRLSQDMSAVSTAQEIGFLHKQQTETIRVSSNHHFFEERSKASKNEYSTDHEDEDANGEEFDNVDYDHDPPNDSTVSSKNESQPGTRLMRFKNGYTILLRKLPRAGNFC